MIDFKEINKEKSKLELKAFALSLCISLSIVLIIMGFVLSSLIYSVIAIIIFPLSTFLFIKVIKSTKIFDEDFKKGIAKAYLESLIDDFKYDIKSGFSKSELINNNIIKDYEYFKSTELMSGRYKNIKFKRCDISLTGVESVDKRIEVSKIFNGKIYLTSLEEKQTFDLFITKDTLINNIEAYHHAKLKNISLTEDYGIFTSDLDSLQSNMTDSFLKALSDLMRSKNLYGIVISNNIFALLINDKLSTFQKAKGDPYSEKIFDKLFKELDTFTRLLIAFNDK